MTLLPFPPREMRWLWAKLRRRMEAPAHRRRMRLPHDAPAGSGWHETQPALPWADHAAIPGDPAHLPTRRANGLFAAMATEVHEHCLAILQAQPVSIDAPARTREPRAFAGASELPAAALAAYRPIEWHCDFHSGYRWDPAQFYLDVQVAPVAGADIKTPRELSRFQHVGALARGPMESGAHEFLLQMLDWIDANPVRHGVNWACTMDVALRAVNWIWGLRLFEPELLRYPLALRKVAWSIHQHGVHIENNLEYYEECTGNHYLSDVAGLLYIGAAFPQFAAADRWLLFALQELVSEMHREVYEDGAAHEASTHYHRLVAELFVSCAALAERITPQRRLRLRSVDPRLHRVRPRLREPAKVLLNLDGPGQLLPGVFYSRLARMAELSAVLTKPNGRVPQFGDNDSARAHKLLPRPSDDVRNHAHLVATIGELLGRDDLRAAGASAREEALLVAGGLEGRIVAPAPTVQIGASRAFMHRAGIAVARSASAWLAVTCGPNGQGGRGGHGHNDKLSFELNVHGHDFVVDGGCPAYSGAPELRNRFRSTWAHSTIALTGAEQDPLPPGPGGLFSLPERCRPRLELTSDGAIMGSHIGYGAPHARRLLLGEGELTIDDTLDLPAERWLVFNLSPRVTVQELSVEQNRARCRLVHAQGVRVTLDVAGASTALVAEGCFGYGYGIPAANASLRVRMSGPAATTRLTWQR